jgi:hypothetical protein
VLPAFGLPTGSSTVAIRRRPDYNGHSHGAFVSPSREGWGAAA